MITRLQFLAILALGTASTLQCAELREFCNASPEVEAAIREAAAVSAAVTDPFAAFDRAAPFLAVRDQYPDSLFAHEAYQDAIHENGIEGHLRLLAKQYTEFESKHSGDPFYRYLLIRATVGRNTLEAIEDLKQLAAENPALAPSHRTLAEIYATEPFRNPELEKIEREEFLAQCPAGTFTRRPPSAPRPSTLIDDAARLLEQGGETDRIIAMTVQGLKEFEWGSQRIRAFDWYSRDYKIQEARDLRTRYWQAWPIQVRAYRQGGQPEMARQVLATMEQRAAQLRAQPGSAYWDAVETLARLYAEGRQNAPAAAKCRELEQILNETQEPGEKARHAARLEALRTLLPADPLSPEN